MRRSVTEALLLGDGALQSPTPKLVDLSMLHVLELISFHVLVSSQLFSDL